MSFIAYIIFAVLVGIWAGRRGRNGIIWTLAALLVSPVLAAIVLAEPGKIRQENKREIEGSPSPRFCKHCGNKVPDDSVFCPKCGSRL